MDLNKLVFDHVTVPKPPVTEVGWRVRRTDTTTRFEITIDDGDTWTTTHSWDGPHTAGDIVRAGYAVGAQHPGARLVEFEEINGTWIPRIEEEEYTLRFKVSTDDGETWTTTHSWDRPTAGNIVRAAYSIGEQHAVTRLVEFEEINGTWIPRIEQEEEEA